eukprot:3024329-Rhodomonas_salina.1
MLCYAMLCYAMLCYAMLCCMATRGPPASPRYMLLCSSYALSGTCYAVSYKPQCSPMNSLRAVRYELWQ